MSDPAAASPDVPTVTRDFHIINKRGLHARAAARFVQCAERFESTITVAKGPSSVDGSSIMGLMMLAAGPGTTVRVSAAGSDAEAAITAIEHLIRDRFGEDE
jgi:phosphocarrier protein HPr